MSLTSLGIMCPSCIEISLKFKDPIPLCACTNCNPPPPPNFNDFLFYTCYLFELKLFDKDKWGASINVKSKTNNGALAH